MGQQSLTIVTTTLNDKTNLLKTIASLNVPSRLLLTHIIIDAGTDQLLQTIFSINCVPNYQISLRVQAGISIYHGMNYGIQLVDTDYYMIINSGTEVMLNNIDTLFSSKLVSANKKIPSIYVGNAMLLDGRHEQKGSNKKYVFCPRTNIVRPTFFPWHNHEAIIYPTTKAITHQAKNFTVACDLAFIGDYASAYPRHYSRTVFVRYTKGGYSDRRVTIDEKRKDYILLIQRWIVQGHIIATLPVALRILKDLLSNMSISK